MSLKSFLQEGTSDSLMRLAGFIAIICIAFITFDAGTCAILGIILNKELDKVSQLIGALAGVIGTLATILLYKAVQKFGEKKSQGQDQSSEEIFDKN